MTDLPAPLTPPDCDLRDFSFMPLDIVRLFGSRFHALASDAEWRAGVTLWAKSFHQVPAGSIPDDDIEMCRLAELGRDIKAWRKVKEGALHGWIKCSDGRLYHPTVSEKANEAWQRKVVQRERSRKGNEKRWGTAGVSGGSHSDGGKQDTARETHTCRDDEQQPTHPQSTATAIPKASLKDGTGSALRIARDRDRDRDREKEKEIDKSFPIPREADAENAAPEAAPSWPPDPHPSAITSRVSQVAIKLGIRQQRAEPAKPARTVEEQLAMLRLTQRPAP